MAKRQSVQKERLAWKADAAIRTRARRAAHTAAAAYASIKPRVAPAGLTTEQTRQVGSEEAVCLARLWEGDATRQHARCLLMAIQGAGTPNGDGKQAVEAQADEVMEKHGRKKDTGGHRSGWP